MNIADVSSTSCAFIPVYCYYDRQQGGEVKTPILMVNQDSFLLQAIVLDLDPSIFTPDELKDQFIEAYYALAGDNGDQKHLDAYDIYPQLVNVLHTDEEEISIYVCELYENSEPYFKKNKSAKVADIVSYKQGLDELIKGGALEPLTEKILVSLLEENYLTAEDLAQNTNSIQLF